MKKNSLILLAFIAMIGFASCGKIPGDVIDNSSANYKVVKITAPSSFVYSATDSSITIAVQFENYSQLKHVWASIKTADGKQSLTSSNELLDIGNRSRGDQVSGDGIYSDVFPMSKKYSNGTYIIEFFAEDNLGLGSESIAKLGEQSMLYNNKQTNYAPVISDLVIPASVIRGTAIKFSIKVTDQNSLGDISSVYFLLYRPDGTIVVNSQGLTQFPMFDDGNTTSNGDLTTGDGVYTVMLTFPETQPTGNWRFEIQAKDKSSSVSNLISKTVEVK